MAPYSPPIKGTSISIPYLAMVVQADPDFERLKHRESQMWQYGFVSGSQHWVDPTTQGAYNRLSNSYAVGQPKGAADPLVTAALATTVGNSVPGLYQGTDDGKGWA